MVKRITKRAFTPEQAARLDEWADRWIEFGLRTGPADREKFEQTVAQCYRWSGLDWHGRVVWTPSPVALLEAIPVAERMFVRHDRAGSAPGAADGRVRHNLRTALITPAQHALWDVMSGTVQLDISRRLDYVVDYVDHFVNETLAAAAAEAAKCSIGGEELDFVVRHFVVRQWARWLAVNSFLSEVCRLEVFAYDPWKRGIALDATVKAAYGWYPHRDFVIACERPTAIHREQVDPAVARGLGSHRLHCANGPAVAFADGWGVYAIHGVRIPFKQRHIVERPETLTAKEIEAEQNVEIRRVMIDRYGPERYIRDSGARVVQKLPADHRIAGLRTGRLLRKRVLGDEPIVYADLLNSTPEPDGTVKRYMLRIDPKAYNREASRNLLAAVASTWRNADGSLHFSDYRDYAPVFES